VPLGPGLLVLVDEAGMAATADLAALIDAVTAAGGSVRLVGDTAQLSSPAAGGILRDLVRAHGAAELDTPVRFTDPAEAAATLAIRAGDPAGLEFYAAHGRIHTPVPATDANRGDRDDHGGHYHDGNGLGDALVSALAAWAADRAAGHDSLLLAGSNTIVAELNARARAARLAAGGDPAPEEVRLRDGTAASPGDLVLARHNDRALRITATESVKNGDRFTVVALSGDGGLVVRHAASRRSLILPAGYVAEHVQLGYAATIHLTQGATVDTTHTVLTGDESREQLYVALTRGRAANHLHLAPAGAGAGAGADDQGDPAHPVLARNGAQVQANPVEVLRAVLARTDARPSATSALADATDPARRLHAAVQRYLDAHTLHAATAGRRGEQPPATGGPLPWLPPPPDPDGGELADYLQRRADFVHALAVGITAAQLPATGWADQLRQTDPDLARQLAVWRAATGITEHPHPLGPADSPTPAVRTHLTAQLPPHLDVDPPDRTTTVRRNAPTGPARRRNQPDRSQQQDRDQQHVRDRLRRPEHDTQLVRAYQRDRDRARGVRR
jgi:hypothetical protein